MGLRSRFGRWFVLGLAVAVVLTGLLGSPWGRPARAEIRALVAGAPVSRAAPAAPAAPSPPALTPGASPARRGPVTVSAQEAVDAAVGRLVAGRPAGSVSISALDRTSGTQVGWGLGGGMLAASVFKLTLLEGDLLDAQGRGQQPGAGQAATLTAMMANSDNDAADRVYAAVGGHRGVTSAMARLGLSATVLDPTGRWGLSTTSAADQLTLLQNLVASRSPLSAASRAYALALMSNVEADQRWGVGAAADPGTSFANKDGWLNVDTDNGRWVVGSVGVLDARGHQLLLAVLTQHNAGFTDGVELVENLSRAVAAVLTGTPTGSGGVVGSQPQR